MTDNPHLARLNELFGEDVVLSALGDIKPNLISEEEAKRIKIHLVGGLTYFFRDPTVFSALETVILLPFNDQPISIASVGCSYGCEIYSILLDYWKKIKQFHLRGYDINLERLAKASNGGPFGDVLENIEVSAELGPPNGEYEIISVDPKTNTCLFKFSEMARENVKFSYHDITDGPLPEKFNVVLLLNMLYHYSPEGQKIILRNAVDSITDNGFLICERLDPNFIFERKEYLKFMVDLSEYGLVKDNTIIDSKIYRKIK